MDNLCKLATELANAYIDWRNADHAHRIAQRHSYPTPIAREAQERIVDVLAVAEKEARNELDGAASRYIEASEIDRNHGTESEEV